MWLFIIYVAFLYLLHLSGLLGHIQISQIPKRDEPSDEGTINFSSFFKGLEEAGYDGWVAGEYFASGIYKRVIASSPFLYTPLFKNIENVRGGPGEKAKSSYYVMITVCYSHGYQSFQVLLKMDLDGQNPIY